MLLLIQLSCDGCWAWPWPIILAFLLGALLGWLLKSLFGSSDEGDDYRKRYLDTKADLEACKNNAKNSLSGASVLGANSLTDDNYKSSNEENNTNSEIVAKSIVADDSVKDDLTKVEGIGPKIQGLLNDDGIWSWKQLSETTVERIQKILDDAGPRYRVHNPASWPMQSEMCDQGAWDKLDKWQDEHKGGRL